MDGLLFIGIFAALGLIVKRREYPAVLLMLLLMLCVAARFVYYTRFTLNLSL